jgi:ubiquinone biosynthesis protein UbiJ
MHQRRKSDKPWLSKPYWLKSTAEIQAENEAAEKAREHLQKCSANLKALKDKYEELNARLAELDELLRK